MQLSKCCVCSQENDCFAIRSTCSDRVLNYCRICANHGYESYEELVEYGFLFEYFNPTFREKVVIPTLRYYNKSCKTFNNDVLSRRKEVNT